MENWDEIKTAYQVARMGTVSGAADVLGVHHATVIRHIDALETRLGVKLFQRHARGYTATEAGQDLFRIAKTTDDQFSQLVGRIKGRGTEVSGDLVVTSLASLVPRLTQVLISFQQAHPDVTIRYLTGTRLFRLEYGEAHVAIRAGNAPEQPDNVVQPLFRQTLGLFAAQAYVARHGVPANPAEFHAHRFIGTQDEGTRAPFNTWLHTLAPDAPITFRAMDERTLEEAVKGGAGIGFLPRQIGLNNPDLVEITPADDTWSTPLWLVTHVDLHRTTKVQAFVQHLKAAAKEWEI